MLGTRPQRLARPLDVPDLRRIVSAVDRTTPKSARDAAIILLGFASALRISELAALTLDDLTTQPGGVLLRIRRSKTDPDAAGQLVGVAHGRHAPTDPVAALDAWLTHRGRTPGALFTTMRGGHRSTEVTDLTGIHGDAIARVLRTHAEAAGLPADRITGHSLRAGHATTAARAGVSIDRIAAQTRHQRVALLIERYIRPVDALDHSSSKDLGL